MSFERNNSHADTENFSMPLFIVVYARVVPYILCRNTLSLFSQTQLLIFLIGLAAVMAPLLKGNIKMINKIGQLGRKFIFLRPSQLSNKTSTNPRQFSKLRHGRACQDISWDIRI